jgi:hypothetical protein
MLRQTIIVAAIALGMAGCQEGAVSIHYHDERPPARGVVVVDQGHVCGPGCSHYWDGARYVVVRRGHRHGPGCGHHLIDGRWVVSVTGPRGNTVVAHGDRHHGHVQAVRIPPPPGPRDHYVYSRSGSKWVKIRTGHRHGPGCGHTIIDGHWHLD